MYKILDIFGNSTIKMMAMDKETIPLMGGQV